MRLAYIGTLGHSYDISVVISAMKRLSKNKLAEVEFIVMGDGPKRQQFEKEAKGLPVFFVGNLPYAEMVWLLVCCDIAVNPIVHGAAQSIINKHMDYAMAGLPVINTQENLEYKNLIEKYNCGINCKCESEKDVLEAIHMFISDSRLLNNMGNNHRKMAEKLFDRKKTYLNILNIVLEGEEKLR